MRSFQAKVSDFHSNLWHTHFVIPEDIALPYFEDRTARIVLHLGDNQYAKAIMRGGDHYYFINVNKAEIKKHGLLEGSVHTIGLTKDESKYGLPVPEELEVLMQEDPEGSAIFHSLAPGQIRALIFVISKPKSSQLRLEKAVLIFEFLKKYQNNLDFKLLNQALKQKYV